MKKSALLLIVLLMTFLAACGGTKNAGDTNQNSDNQTEANSSTEKETAPNVEIVNQASGAWMDSIGTAWVHTSAVFENTGDVPVAIGETQMNFKGQDDSILGTATMIYSVPEVVMPGETAYITESTILDGITDPAQFKETTFNYNFEETEEDANLLEVSGVKGIKGDEYTPYKVTGIVKNTTDELQDDVRIAAGLYDAEGNLLGVFNGSVDVGINSGSEAGFELSYPDLPEGVADKVATIDVKAYGWTW
ncbi:MAG: FxLYD domain-containing protein [Bacillus sp. (in: firmicutes)]